MDLTRRLPRTRRKWIYFLTGVATIVWCLLGGLVFDVQDMRAVAIVGVVLLFAAFDRD